MSPKIPLSSLSNFVSNPIDLVITCASFEDRCLSASLVLPEQQIASAIIFFIEEFSSFSSYIQIWCTEDLKKSGVSG